MILFDIFVCLMTKKVSLKKGKNLPLVSVIIPAHNAGKFITETIESILRQTYKNLELMIVNDGSTDNTADVIKQFLKKDKRVCWISYQMNRGESAAANLGFFVAKGDYIARMDADDIAHPERIAKQIDFLEKNPDYIVVGTQAHIIDGEGEIIGEKVFPTTHDEIYQSYGVLHPMLHPSIMVRRSLLPRRNKLWAEKLEPNDDYYTLFELLHRGKFANLPEKLMYYRMHEHNKSLQRIKRKFLNSIRIRFRAVKEFGYPLTVVMVVKMLAQAAIVLTLPEFVTAGAYLWLRGMKPFDKAFPVVARWKTQLSGVLSPKNLARYTGLTMVASLRALVSQK